MALTNFVNENDYANYLRLHLHKIMSSELKKVSTQYQRRLEVIAIATKPVPKMKAAKKGKKSAC